MNILLQLYLQVLTLQQAISLSELDRQVIVNLCNAKISS